MITTRFCPQCQQPVSVDAPAGLCPQCLMKGAAGPPPSAAGDGLTGDLVDIANPAEVAKKLPQFEILELLGRGGMGVVYKARQLNLDRVVALKILPPLDAQSPDFVARFTREARALAKLNHPNIVNVYDFGETGGLYYIIMEFVDGANLRQLFQTRKLTSAEALAIVPRVCDALQYAHEEGLVHRDIKPENLLIDKKGRVKIADFGLAKLLRREPLDMTLTLSGTTLGTLRYMAPEQMDKPETVDHRADLYSLGVVIYEMLTGETPVGRFELPSQKAQVDVRFDEIVLHALEREPDRRYQHASQVREDVEKVTSQPEAAAVSTPLPGPTRSVSSVDDVRRKLRYAGIALLLAGIADFGYGLYSIGSNVSQLSGLMKQGAPVGWQVAETVLSLCMLVAVYYIVGVAKHLMSPEDEGDVTIPLLCAAIIPPGLVFGLPAAILAFVQLSRPEAKALIPSTTPEPPASAAAPAPASEKRPPRHLLSAFLVLLMLFGFFFGLSFQAKHSGTAAGMTKIITVGALDPLYTSESGPSGFQTGINFFSWSFFAVVVAGITFGALWRIGREDQGKVPRDPAWWRDWWKQVGVWGGLLLIVCIVRTAMDPAKVLQSPGNRTVGSRSAVVAEELSAGATNVLFRDFRYRVTAPVNQRATFWVELWRDGELVRDAGATGGQSYEPPSGRNLDGTFIFTVADAAEWGPGAEGQLIWDFTLVSPLFDGTKAANNTKFKLERSDALAMNRKWIGNSFADLEVRSSWGSKRSWTTVGGDPITLLVLSGHAPGKAPAVAPDEAAAKKSKTCLLLKVRFHQTNPAELKDESVTKYLDAYAVDNTSKPTAAPTDDKRFVIAQDRSQLPTTATPGRQDYAFRFSGPADHTLCVWMEVWQEGKMEWVSDFDFEAKPKSGEPLEATLKLTTMDGDVASVESKEKTRFDWTMHCGGSNGTGSTGGAWRANILKPMGAIYSTWDRQPKALNPRPGETVTVLGITGYKLSNFRSAMSGHTEADLLKRWPNAAVLIRARFSPARPGQLNEGVAVSVNVSDKAGERRTFAQFEISKQLGVDLSACRTPAEAHAALVAAASTPDGRARAAQMVDEFGSDNIAYVDQFRFAAEPMSAMWWKLRKKEPTTAEEVVGLLENFITAVSGPGSHGVQWNHGEPIIKWAEGPLLKDDFAKKLKLTKLQVDEVNKLLKKYADEANALRRRHTKVTKNDQGHVLINIEPYSEECLELARKMVAELGGIVTQDIVPAVKVGALPMAIFGNAGECRETVELKKDSDGVYVFRIVTSDWVPAGEWRGDNTTGWGSKDIDFAFGSYKMYWTEE